MQEWKMRSRQQGKWWKCRSDNEWKAVRKEKYKIPTTWAEHDIVIITAKTQKPSLSKPMRAYRTSKQYLGPKPTRWIRILSFHLAYRTSIHFYTYTVCFSVLRMPLGRWPAFVRWYQIITVKQWNYDEKQQTKNQRVSILQTRCILCSLYYLAAHHTCLSNLPLCKTKVANIIQYYKLQ